MIPPVSPQLDAKVTRRNLLKLFAWGGAVLLFPQVGCQGAFSRKQKCPATECPSGGTVVATPRRVFVIETTPPERCVGGAHHQFVMEVVAALNQQPGCNAVMLPPNFPLQELIHVKPGVAEGEAASHVETDGAIEEILLINVIEVLPYRPMRLQALVERRLMLDGSLISRNTRTWNAPADCEPQGPSKANRFALWHPAPLAAIESKELNRLSPHTFMKNVANEIAVELVTRPI